MHGEKTHFYDFKSFRLNLGERQLLNAKAPVSLTPKAFDVLAVLVEHAGHLVEKEELMQLVWPNSFVEEANVARIVHTLRKALGDDGNGNSFIETVPTKGYRFVAEVSKEKGGLITRSPNGLSTTPDTEPSETESTLNQNKFGKVAETQVRTHRSRWAFVLLGTVIVVAVAGWVWSAGRKSLGVTGLKSNLAITLNTDASFNYKEGKILLEKRKDGEGARALEYFDKAIQLDPNFAEAYAGKAVVKMWQFESTRAPDDMAQARTAIDRALEINGSSSFAYFALCRIKITYDWEFQKGEQACLNAIELDPHNHDAHFELAMFRSMFGRVEEALAEIDTAIALAPTSLNKRSRGFILYFARRYDDAIEQMRQIGKDDPAFDSANSIIVRSAEMKRDYDTAFDAQVKLFENQGRSAETFDLMREKYASQGWPGVLKFIVNLPEEPQRPRVGGGLVYVAGMYCQLGEYETAYKYLEKAFKQRNVWMIHQARDPRFDPMRSDPRFQELLTRIGLK
ncbi:MAG: winged helix-turn-helix domain-containing protein [Pyrinomonadaceae bacterium]